MKHFMETYCRIIWAAEGGKGAYNLHAIKIQFTRRTGMNLYFDVTRAYMVVAHSFATFGGSYMLLIKNYLEKKLQLIIVNIIIIIIIMSFH